MASNQQLIENSTKKTIKAEIVVDETNSGKTYDQTPFNSFESKKNQIQIQPRDVPVFAACKENPIKKGSRLDKLDSKHKAIFSKFFKYLRVGVVGRLIKKPKILKLFRVPQGIVRKINISDMSKTLSSNLQEIFQDNWPHLLKTVLSQCPEVDYPEFMIIMLKPISFHYLEYLQTPEYKKWLVSKALSKSKDYVDSLKLLAETVIEYFFETPPNKRKNPPMES